MLGRSNFPKRSDQKLKICNVHVRLFVTHTRERKKKKRNCVYIEMKRQRQTKVSKSVSNQMQNVHPSM